MGGGGGGGPAQPGGGGIAPGYGRRGGGARLAAMPQFQHGGRWMWLKHVGQLQPRRWRPGSLRFMRSKFRCWRRCRDWYRRSLLILEFCQCCNGTGYGFD